MLEGLDPARANGSCKHVCLAETAGIAAGLELAPVVIEVDVSGLDLFFELGEARHHGAPIPPECLRPLDPRPLPDTSGWSDPFCRRNHTDCLAAMELPFSRRLLREAAAEADRRWWRDGYSFDQFKAVVDELSRRVPTNG
jgi:hypothetical protein